jgi:pimeloyl-ACP methyl ester carboxylesterase
MTVARVVFLPGASGDASFWAPVAERLPRQLDRVLLAWPGLGNVAPRADVRGFTDLLRLTLETIDRDVALVAQSMGAIVALLATLDRPERVRRLVLAATSGGVDVHRFGATDWRPDYRREYPAAAPWIFDVSIDLTDRIPTITTPTLLLWGDADPISPVSFGKHLASLLPRAGLVVIPGGDHSFARDRADEVAPHIARHLDAGLAPDG